MVEEVKQKKIKRIITSSSYPIFLFIVLISMIIIQGGIIETLKDRINALEDFTNIKNYNLGTENFYASRMPLWRQCVNGKQQGEPLAYAWVLVNKDFMISVPEDELAYKNGTLYLDEFNRGFV
mgnify:CR=1 FL=1